MPERPTIDAMPDTSQGAAKVGKSSRITALKRFMVDLELVDEALMAFSRWIGSVMSLARLTRIMLAWLFAVSSPASRRLTGTPATRGLAGSSLLSAR